MRDFNDLERMLPEEKHQEICIKDIKHSMQGLSPIEAAGKMRKCLKLGEDEVITDMRQLVKGWMAIK